MGKVIDIKSKIQTKSRKSEILSYKTTQFAKQFHKAPEKATDADIRKLNDKIVIQIILELTTAVKREEFENGGISNVYTGSIKGDYARLMHRYKLDERVFKHFIDQGLYFHFKYTKKDMQPFANILLYWDRNYTKFIPRLTRRVGLFFNMTSLV